MVSVRSFKRIQIIGTEGHNLQWSVSHYRADHVSLWKGRCNLRIFCIYIQHRPDKAKESHLALATVFGLEYPRKVDL